MNFYICMVFDENDWDTLIEQSHKNYSYDLSWVMNLFLAKQPCLDNNDCIATVVFLLECRDIIVATTYITFIGCRETSLGIM